MRGDPDLAAHVVLTGTALDRPGSSTRGRTARRAAALAAALVLGLAPGCGAEVEPEAPVAIAFARQELLQDAATLAIYFYGGSATCGEVRAASPRPPSILGPYMAVLDDDGRTRGVTFTLTEVPAGVYLVFVDALDASGALIGTGCAPAQTIHDRQRSRVLVTIS